MQLNILVQNNVFDPTLLHRICNFRVNVSIFLNIRLGKNTNGAFLKKSLFKIHFLKHILCKYNDLFY